MNITVEELLKRDNLNIIDLRSNQSYNNNHIKGAINIPYNNLLANPFKYLDKTKRYYLYCQKGITSKKVCGILNLKGFHTYNILGGYEEWILKS